MHSIVCLVVDECHRAVGNAPAAEAADILRKDKAHFRMLGLSATPGKSHEAVQVRVHLVLRVHLILCAPGFAGAPVFACT
jgi:Fanconi anemia group M protein